MRRGKEFGVFFWQWTHPECGFPMGEGGIERRGAGLGGRGGRHRAAGGV